MSWPEYNPVSDTPKYKLRFDRFDVCLIQTCRINDDIVARRKFPLHRLGQMGAPRRAGELRGRLAQFDQALQVGGEGGGSEG